MPRQRDCDPAVIAGRLAKAEEFLASAEILEGEMPNSADDLFIDAGIAAADVICCVRLGVHSNSGRHTEALALMEQADAESKPHLAALLGVKNKVAYTHESLSAAEHTRMSRAATHLVEAAKRAAASRARPEPTGDCSSA